MNYADLLGGGGNVRVHSPLSLSGICLAHIADILLLTLGLFAVLAPLSRTRLYPLVRLLLAMLIPPYLIERTRPLFGFALPDGILPINTDGGLLANGEPVGASGLRQVYELVQQLRGSAGDRQVPDDPQVGLAQLYGAPGTAAVAILSK